MIRGKRCKTSQQKKDGNEGVESEIKVGLSKISVKSVAIFVKVVIYSILSVGDVSNTSNRYLCSILNPYRQIFHRSSKIRQIEDKLMGKSFSLK